ncbi:hypothetical protein DFH27DRAFT_606048 [Peziza echinospora]|nr:hypothetical protein DFH27DRAFT_606048 [Peziza echinospora]
MVLNAFAKYKKRFSNSNNGRAPFNIVQDLPRRMVDENKHLQELVNRWRELSGKDYRRHGNKIVLKEGDKTTQIEVPSDGSLPFDASETIQHRQKRRRQTSPSQQATSPQDEDFFSAPPEPRTTQRSNAVSTKSPAQRGRGSARGNTPKTITFRKPAQLVTQKQSTAAQTRSAQKQPTEQVESQLSSSQRELTSFPILSKVEEDDEADEGGNQLPESQIGS